MGLNFRRGWVSPPHPLCPRRPISGGPQIKANHPNRHQHAKDARNASSHRTSPKHSTPRSPQTPPTSPNNLPIRERIRHPTSPTQQRHSPSELIHRDRNRPPATPAVTSHRDDMLRRRHTLVNPPPVQPTSDPVVRRQRAAPLSAVLHVERRGQPSGDSGVHRSQHRLSHPDSELVKLRISVPNSHVRIPGQPRHSDTTCRCTSPVITHVLCAESWFGRPTRAAVARGNPV
ncbi:hypothetical protein SAMN05192558_105268 [Actinokineospora alba]|uniref:Uncharacterized protein n=1 Tax=Actinokineospora alba TaxID=504798 RepID=A0A1H0N9Y7_9PSEU|nr:hypothetical protein C8E96_4203 [Actinokineospora alba]SDH83387.1 hypothetical protein SAMN05421871_102318 [Actinokineospora alba]SDO89483.1 hypothetical protein SAMN05192558_105268 [Actinokineospora alba]